MRQARSGYNDRMKECPLAREFRNNPMRAAEFLEGHKKLPLWVRLLHGLLQRAAR